MRKEVRGDGGVDRDRPADELDRRGGVAGLKGEDPEHIQRIGMIGSLGKDLAIDSLRLGELAKSAWVMAKGDLERLTRS